MSNYDATEVAEEVRVEVSKERPCSTCRGRGYVEMHGQETDCIPCEGWGTILID